MKSELHAKKHILIIGAGFGGMACVRRLARLSNVAITLVDKRNHHLFQPLLYQVATSTLTAPDIARSVRGIFKGYSNVDVRYDEATDIDQQRKIVTFTSGNTLSFDYLVLATGAKTSFFGNNHWQDYTLQLKSLSDAFEIRKKVLSNLELADRSPETERERLSTVVIVGGGPTGVELAGAFSDLIQRTMRSSFRHFDASKQRILLLEGMPDLLAPFSLEQRAYAKNHLTELGVEVRTNALVENIEAQKVTLKGGEIIEAGAIIWTAGVEGNAVAQTLNTTATRSGKIIVNPDLSVQGAEDIYVIGDAAALEQANGSPVPGVAPAAVQGGEFVACHIGARIHGIKPEAVFEYFDKGKMAVIGKGSAIVDVRGYRSQGWIGWLIWLFIHVLFLVDFRSKLSVLINWFWSYVQNSPGSRVFTTSSTQAERANGMESSTNEPPRKAS